MTVEQITLNTIESNIAKLPEDKRRLCAELVREIKRLCEDAGPEVSALAIGLIGAELQCEM